MVTFLKYLEAFMKVFFFALVYIFSLQIVAMEAGFKYPSNDIYRWQECGEQPKYSFDPDMVTQREVVTVENNISDWLASSKKRIKPMARWMPMSCKKSMIF